MSDLFSPPPPPPPPREPAASSSPPSPLKGDLLCARPLLQPAAASAQRVCGSVRAAPGAQHLPRRGIPGDGAQGPASAGSERVAAESDRLPRRAGRRRQ